MGDDQRARIRHTALLPHYEELAGERWPPVICRSLSNLRRIQATSK
jgi:hypothetical protein